MTMEIAADIEKIFLSEWTCKQTRAVLHEKLQQLGLVEAQARRVLIDCLFSAQLHALWGGRMCRAKWELSHLEHAILIHLVDDQTRGRKWLNTVQCWLRCEGLAISQQAWRKILNIAVACYAGNVPQALKATRELVEHLGEKNVEPISHVERITNHVRSQEHAGMAAIKIQKAIEESDATKRDNPQSNGADGDLNHRQIDARMGLLFTPMKLGVVEIIRDDREPNIAVIAAYLNEHDHRVGLLKHPTGTRVIEMVLPAGSTEAREIIRWMRKTQIIGSKLCRRADGTTTFSFDCAHEPEVMQVLYKHLQPPQG